MVDEAALARAVDEGFGRRLGRHELERGSAGLIVATMWCCI